MGCIAAGDRALLAPVVSDAADDDGALVRAVARGDRAALGGLYERYAGVLLAIALRITRDRREAEDLLHELYLEVWRRAGDWDARRGTVRTWLSMLMRSRALDVVKSARVARSVELDPKLFAGQSADDALAPDRARVRRLLAELPPEQAVVLALAFFEGLSGSEISARLDVPLGTVKSRAAAGLAKLRGRLQ